MTQEMDNCRQGGYYSIKDSSQNSLSAHSRGEPSFQILGILKYACRWKLRCTLILSQDSPFEKASK